MPREVIVLTVLLSSPSDVSDERACVEDVIDELNRMWRTTRQVRLELIRWETYAVPGAGTDPQAVIDRQLPQDYDIFVGMLWHRFGTPTPRAGSGTEEEFDAAYERFHRAPGSVRIMFYFKDTAAPPSEIDPQQLAAVCAFRKRLGEKGVLYWTFKDTEHFRGLIRLHLSLEVENWLKRHEAPTAPARKEGEGRAGAVSDQEVSSPVTTEQDADFEDLGFIDYVLTGLDSFDGLTKVGERMRDLIEDLGARFQRSTEELENVQRTSKDPKTHARKAKRVVDQMAADMEQYVTRMDAEIPVFSDMYSRGVNAYGRAASLAGDFEQITSEQIDEAVEGVRQLRSALAGIRDGTVSFKQVVSSLPRATARFRKAKARTVEVTDKLITEIGKCDNVSMEIEKVFKSLS